MNHEDRSWRVSNVTKATLFTIVIVSATGIGLIGLNNPVTALICRGIMVLGVVGLLVFFIWTLAYVGLGENE